jgi:hypothetical protein
VFTLGGAISQHVPHALVLPLLLLAQFVYWALFVFAVRWLVRSYQLRHSHKQ